MCLSFVPCERWSIDCINSTSVWKFWHHCLGRMFWKLRWSSHQTFEDLLLSNMSPTIKQKKMHRVINSYPPKCGGILIWHTTFKCRKCHLKGHNLVVINYRTFPNDHVWLSLPHQTQLLRVRPVVEVTQPLFFVFLNCMIGSGCTMQWRWQRRKQMASAVTLTAAGADIFHVKCFLSSSRRGDDDMTCSVSVAKLWRRHPGGRSDIDPDKTWLHMDVMCLYCLLHFASLWDHPPCSPLRSFTIEADYNLIWFWFWMRRWDSATVQWRGWSCLVQYRAVGHT